MGYTLWELHGKLIFSFNCIHEDKVLDLIDRRILKQDGFMSNHKDLKPIDLFYKLIVPLNDTGM